VLVDAADPHPHQPVAWLLIRKPQIEQFGRVFERIAGNLKPGDLGVTPGFPMRVAVGQETGNGLLLPIIT
jgi:hypothetical protein